MRSGRGALLSMGLRNSIRVGLNRAIDRFLGIDTTGSASPDEQSRSRLTYHDPVKSVAVDYVLLWNTLNALHLRSHDVFVDIGCGAGRAVCVASRRSISKVIGIEFDRNIAALARDNAARVRRRCASVQIVCTDAALADYTEGSAFFLYNPFGAETLAAVLARIKASLASRPRAIRLAYVQPKQEHLLAQSEWLSRYGTARIPFFHTAAGLWRTTGNTPGR